MKERKACEIFAEDEEYEYVQLRSGLTARRRKQKAGEMPRRRARDPEALGRARQILRQYTKIVRADRDAR